MSTNEELAEQLRELATSFAGTSLPDLRVALHEAAAALSAGCQHEPLDPGEPDVGVLGAYYCEDEGDFGWGMDSHDGYTDCSGPHLPLYVEAEQTEQDNDEDH